MGLVQRILKVLTLEEPDAAQEKDAIALLEGSLDPGSLLVAGKIPEFESAVR